MVVDTSAIVAILAKEAGSERLVDALVQAPKRRMSVASLIESGIVLQVRYGDHGERELDLLVQRAALEIIPVTAEHAELARGAFRRFGKGHHPARLNFGDCFSYALAAALGEPLLCKGDDFVQTDLETVSVDVAGKP